MSDSDEDYDEFSVSPEIPITPIRYEDLSTSSSDATLTTPGNFHDVWNQKAETIETSEELINFFKYYKSVTQFQSTMV